MTLKQFGKTFFPAFALLIATACKDNNIAKSDNPSDNMQNEKTNLAAYPLKQQFKCLPQTAAIIAAHRGTARNHGLAENAKQGLIALINHGTLIAEIDVAKSKDGKHFLFHDGVWEDDTTGKGVVAATNWKEAKRFLLNDTQGKLTSETLISLDDYLKLAKNNIYLEIDFKSSAVYQTVINRIRYHNMSDKVILIAYSQGQARKLAKIAPEMMVSVSVNNQNDLKSYASDGLKTENIAAWTGRDGPSQGTTKLLTDRDIPILAYPSKDKAQQLSKIANLIVSDYALDQKPIVGTYNKLAYKACLEQK